MCLKIPEHMSMHIASTHIPHHLAVVWLLALLVSLPLLACHAMKLCKLSCGRDCLQDSPQQFDTKREYVYQSELYGLEGRPLDPLAHNHLPNHPDGDASSSGRGESGGVHYGPQWGLLTLSQPITASEVSCCTAAHQMLRLPRCATYMSLRHCLILSHKLGVIFPGTKHMLQPVVASCRMSHVFHAGRRVCESSMGFILYNCCRYSIATLMVNLSCVKYTCAAIPVSAAGLCPNWVQTGCQSGGSNLQISVLWTIAQAT